MCRFIEIFSIFTYSLLIMKLYKLRGISRMAESKKKRTENDELCSLLSILLILNNLS